MNFLHYFLLCVYHVTQACHLKVFTQKGDVKITWFHRVLLNHQQKKRGNILFVHIWIFYLSSCEVILKQRTIFKRAVHSRRINTAFCPSPQGEGTISLRSHHSWDSKIINTSLRSFYNPIAIFLVLFLSLRLNSYLNSYYKQECEFVR